MSFVWEFKTVRGARITPFASGSPGTAIPRGANYVVEEHCRDFFQEWQDSQFFVDRNYATS
jgi:hypothetical protein